MGAVIKYVENSIGGVLFYFNFGPSMMLKFIYSVKATKFCKKSTLLLIVCTVVNSKVDISQNFVAFSEYMKLTEEAPR